MLVLSRRCTQSIRIGEEIRITIVRTERGRVRLGIEAPDRVAIWREELGPDSPEEIGVPAGIGYASARS